MFTQLHHVLSFFSTILHGLDYPLKQLDRLIMIQKWFHLLGLPSLVAPRIESRWYSTCNDQRLLRLQTYTWHTQIWREAIKVLHVAYIWREESERFGGRLNEYERGEYDVWYRPVQTMTTMAIASATMPYRRWSPLTCLSPAPLSPSGLVILESNDGEIETRVLSNVELRCELNFSRWERRRL